jgi:transcriptional regulator with PAS, ATPase and Fis domain
MSSESRKRKHRQTDKDRRKRIKIAMETLKAIVSEPDSKLDHASTIESAVALLKTLKSSSSVLTQYNEKSSGILSSLDGLQLGAIFVSIDGIILGVNDTMASITGFNKQDLLSKNMRNVLNSQFFVQSFLKDSDGSEVTVTDMFGIIKDAPPRKRSENFLHKYVDKHGNGWQCMMSASMVYNQLLIIGRVADCL